MKLNFTRLRNKNTLKFHSHSQFGRIYDILGIRSNTQCPMDGFKTGHKTKRYEKDKKFLTTENIDQGLLNTLITVLSTKNYRFLHVFPYRETFSVPPTHCSYPLYLSGAHLIGWAHTIAHDGLGSDFDCGLR